VKHHDRPWKCSIQDCEYADGGFLSRKMRDDHCRDHTATDSQKIPDAEIPGGDDIQPLLFDLVRADRVDAVRNLLHRFQDLHWKVQVALRECAASSGSAAMYHLIDPFHRDGFPTYALKLSIQAANKDLFKHLLSRKKDCLPEWDTPTYSSIVSDVLMCDSEEIFEEWEKYIVFESTGARNRDVEQRTAKASRHVMAPIWDRCTQPNVVRATAGHPRRENWLISIWEKIGGVDSLDRVNRGGLLVSVAKTTCSVRLAKYLVDHGAEMDFRRSTLYLTPLRFAARQNSAAAAEMMKYLLLQGADPELEAGRPGLKIRDGKGAKGISRWLGMSWDELVAKTKEERTKMA
jgi:hypothetical protein